MANELVYYGIYNRNYPSSMQIGSEDALYGYRKETDIDHRVITVNPSFDPIEILPPELSLRCLFDALQSGANDRLYQSSLLQMLNVSERWYHFMISAPLLWSEIHVDCSAPDLLATLAAFTHLSGVVPLNVVIWGDPGTSWTEIGDIMLLHSRRIRSFTFQAISPVLGKAEAEVHVAWIKRVFGSFQCLDGLQELDFSFKTDFHSHNLDLPTIPRGILVISPLDISLLQVDSPMASLRNYASITTEHCLDDIIPLLCLLPVGDVGLYGENVAQKPASNIKLPLEAVSHLKSIRYHQPYCITLDRLLRVTAHQLSHLELQVGHSTTQEMINTLSQLVNLKHLRLHSGYRSIETAPTLHPSCGAVIHSLSTLHIIGRIGGVIDSLCMVFTTMYPSVRNVKLIVVSIVSSICAAYLASLASIETLYFGFGSPQSTMHLPSLQSLSTSDHHALQYFKLPNLLALDIHFTRGGSTQFDTVCPPSLRKLTINSRTLELELHLEPSDYPELRRLTLSHATLRWQLSSLPNLISITLDSFPGRTPNGTLLCVELLYHPGYCPALQQIWFSEMVEWDMLFLMLEKRNQGTTSVSRINAVGLPFVPFILRKPLAFLLEGRSAERPPNLELSFEGARELLCDDTIPGCFECLRHTRPHCLEPTRSGPSTLPLKLDKFLVEYPDPPGDVPTDIRDWVIRYQRLREEWEHLEIYRSKFCGVWR